MTIERVSIAHLDAHRVSIVAKLEALEAAPRSGSALRHDR
jgi:hypothetical protein